MKKTTTFIIALFLSLTGFSQVAITLDSTNIPVPTYPFNIDDITTSLPANPAIGDNQTWSYPTNFGNNPSVTTYLPEVRPYFTAAGIEVKIADFKNLNAGFGYLITGEYKFNSTGVYESGSNIDAQAYELSQYTGSTLDSLTIPSQQYLFSLPKILMSFPFTKYSSWHSVSSRMTNFNLTVAAYALNNAPGQHIYNYFRNDSIVGWGKMSVYTSSGPSIQYDVLMEQVEQFAVDSFYLNGAPANSALLAAFQVTQGQRTNIQYSYNFYRAGSFNFLMRFFYGADDTYSTLSAAYLNTDNITNVGNVSNVSYSTIVFPNPANSDELNIKVVGREINLSDYSITDLLGNTVQQGKIENSSAGITKLSLNSALANGSYLIKVKDKNNVDVVNEKINLQR